MARLNLNTAGITTVLAKYPALPLTVNSADIVWTASGADFADGAKFTLTGREVLLIRNDNAGAQTVTITSVIDDKNRTGDITAYSIGIGEYAVMPPFSPEGWMQTDGCLYFAASAADLYFAVLRVPAMN